MDIGRVRAIAHVCLDTLEASRERLDGLNVYPVPDGDTGTNLAATLRAVVKALDSSAADDTRTLAGEIENAALRGAKGNSGVILSQLARGAAETMGEASVIDAGTLARALRAASDAADRAVREPVEGTILTVAREMAEEAEQSDAELELGQVLRRALARGEESLARTPDLLPVLRDAGVVDAGGAGLVEIVRGIVAGLTGEVVERSTTGANVASVAALHLEPSRFRYCTVFVLEGNRLDAGLIEAELEPLGDSLLVVGDAGTLKVHVHTDDPGAALSLGTRIGTIDGIEIADMRRQALEREQRLASELLAAPLVDTGVVVVSMGDGNRRLFVEEGAHHVVEGGASMNPSTAELLAAIEATPAREVVVLPNDPNVQLAAEQAATLASKPTRVLPSRSLQAGLAAIVSYGCDRDADENEREMRAAIAQVVAGGVTVASRDVVLDGVSISSGAWLGLVDGTAVACGDTFEEVAATVVGHLLANGQDVLTVLTGIDSPDLEPLLSRIAAGHPRVDIDVHVGGQPHYPLLLSAE